MLPDRSVLIGQKLVENAKIAKIQMRHFESFSNNVGLLYLDLTRKLAENPPLFTTTYMSCQMDGLIAIHQRQ